MIQVGLLTESQKNELVGQLYDEDSYFNPIQDIEDNWIISVEKWNFALILNLCGLKPYL